LSNTGSSRFEEKANQDRRKLIASVIGMAILTVVSISISYMGVSMFALLPISIVVFAAGVFFAMRQAKKLEMAGFEGGMNLALESVPMDCSILDEKGAVLHCNDGAAALFQATKRQYAEHLFRDFTPETQPDGAKSQEKAGAHMQAAFRNGKESFEWEHQLGPGKEKIPCAITLAATTIYDTKRVMVFNTDLRKARAMERQEAAFKERMQGVLDSSPMVCALYDEKGDIMDVNKEVENMFGIADRQAFVRDFSRFLPSTQPDGSDSVRKSTEMLMKCVRDGSIRYEWTYLHSDGSQIPTEEILQRITVDGKKIVIAYSRDLREYYRERERERVVQAKMQAMLEQLNSHVEEQAASVTTSSAATEEMIANIQSVTDTLSKNTQSVRELQEASVAGYASLNEVVADIQGIARESESLLEINAVMQNVASQTNLLSMNASIEAAHAGEAGRGFSVVADEIRKLAESSSKQSKTIKGVLKSIKESIDKITKSTDGVLGRFSAIEDGVKTVARQEDSILSAMEEQGQGSKQILKAVGNVNEVTHKVKEAARRMVETSKEKMHKASDTEAHAFTDELTGVRNREYFAEAAEKELRYCVSEDRDFNLIVFSIDSLDRIAGAHGPAIRDEALKILTLRARNSLKQGTLVARYSEEEFAVTLPNVRHGTAMKLAEQIQKKVKDAPFATKGLRLDVSISMGIASKTSSSKTLREIAINAEKALADAKASGANRLASFGG